MVSCVGTVCREGLCGRRRRRCLPSVGSVCGGGGEVECIVDFL